MQEKITSGQWYRFRRLELAGMHLPTPLAAPNHPVRVESLEHDCNVFPVDNGVGVLVSVRITADSPIIIGEYRLSWEGMPELSLPGNMKQLDVCNQHSTTYTNKYCFVSGSKHDTIELGNLAIEKIWASATLRRGLWLRGSFSALLPAEQTFASPVVSATLRIFDVMGNEYPYPLRLKISERLVVKPGSALQ